MVWEEFHADWGRLAIECEALRRRLLHDDLGAPLPAESAYDYLLSDFTGETRQALVQQRVQQGFFRCAVLSSYRNRCCISGVSDKRLLVASHIVPWSVDRANRLNPSNGLCLSAIHDKAFDSYLFTLSEDWRIVLSKQLKTTKDKFLREVFGTIDGKEIELPERFAPDATLIRRHRENMLNTTNRE